jgi:hypothetical protein
LKRAKKEKVGWLYGFVAKPDPFLFVKKAGKEEFRLSANKSINFFEKNHDDFLIPPVISLIVVKRYGESKESDFVK